MEENHADIIDTAALNSIDERDNHIFTYLFRLDLRIRAVENVVTADY